VIFIFRLHRKLAVSVHALRAPCSAQAELCLTCYPWLVPVIFYSVFKTIFSLNIYLPAFPEASFPWHQLIQTSAIAFVTSFYCSDDLCLLLIDSLKRASCFHSFFVPVINIVSTCYTEVLHKYLLTGQINWQQCFHIEKLCNMKLWNRKSLLWKTELAFIFTVLHLWMDILLISSV
jgi:hypothetical protein